MNSQPMTKMQFREALGGCSDAEIARFFGITQAAVSQWKDDQGIPELRWLQAGRLRPDLFGPKSEAA